MTRRSFLSMVPATALAARSPAPLVVPIHRVMDARADCPPETTGRFWSKIWPEAARTFGQCGIQFQTTDAAGEIRRSPGDRPTFVGLERGAINLVLTGHIPMQWDKGLALAGLTVLYGPYHLCLIALRYAHAHQIPFLAVNTCVHELLHVLLQDIYISSPRWYQEGGHEFRIDWCATRMWLFHDDSGVRKSAAAYLERLRSGGSSSIGPKELRPGPLLPASNR